MNRNIVKYLVSTYLVSWFFWGVLVAAKYLSVSWLIYGTPIGMTLFILGGLSPAICEIILHKRSHTKLEFKAFIMNIVGVKHHIWMYVYAVGGAFLILLIPIICGYGRITQPIYLGILMILPMLIGGGLEEIGWRGLLQPELEKRLPHEVTILVVSVVWAMWHLPLWFIEGTSQYSMNFGWFCVYAMTLSFFIGFVRYVSKSIFMAILAHATINGLYEVMAPSEELLVTVVTMVVVSMSTIIIDRLFSKSKHGVGLANL